MKYSYNLTDEQIGSMTLEELNGWKEITGMNLYSYYGRNDEALHRTYCAIMKARDKYILKRDNND